MPSELIGLISIGIIAYIWSSNRKAYALAKLSCQSICKRHQLELLDDTIAGTRITVKRTPNGLRLQRVYSFDYTDISHARKTGFLMMTGQVIDYIRLEESPDVI